MLDDLIAVARKAGPLRAQIELANAGEIFMSSRGLMDACGVHRVSVTAIVSTASQMLAISEALCRELALTTIESQMTVWPKDKHEKVIAVGPLEVRYNGRSTITRALVVPKLTEVLLGLNPMRNMGLFIDWRDGELMAPIIRWAVTAHCRGGPFALCQARPSTEGAVAADEKQSGDVDAFELHEKDDEEMIFAGCVSKQ